MAASQQVRHGLGSGEKQRRETGQAKQDEKDTAPRRTRIRHRVLLSGHTIRLDIGDVIDDMSVRGSRSHDDDNDGEQKNHAKKIEFHRPEQ